MPRYRNAIKIQLASVEVTDVPATLHRGMSPGRVHPKRCYARAFEFFDAHRGEPVTLCHGVVDGQGRWGPFRHAWVEIPTVGPSGLVFDGVVQMFCDLFGYHRLMAVRPGSVRRYDHAAVARLLRTHRHPGPWDETAAVR